MENLVATVKIVLAPGIGEAEASDWLSAVLSEANMNEVLDWGYVEDWKQQVLPDDYQEGDIFAAQGGAL